MKTLTVLAIAILILGAALGGFWYGQHHAGAKDPDDAATTQPAAEEKPIATVTVAPARTGPISETLTAYGSIIAQPGEVQILSVPFESRVQKILVIPGQTVAAGADVVQIEASADALVSLEEAKNTLAAAERDLKLTEQRFADHLATNAELSQVQNAQKAAMLKLDSLTARGVGVAQKLKSQAAGIVSKINAQEGQIVPAGTGLMELAVSSQIEASLGVEPEDIAYLKPQAPVELAPIGRATTQPSVGRIRVIAQRVDPATRLASVLVSLPPDTHWMLDTFVAGKIIKASASGLIVTRDAVLPDEGGGYSLFTVKGGKAVKHTVRLGLENDRDAQIITDDVKEGDPVIILGNYELEDGMAVEIETPAAQPTADRPATTEATR